MPLEVFKPTASGRSRRRGEPKIRIVATSNGNVQVSISAAVREFLQPTPAKDTGLRETLVVAMLVDAEEGKFALQRVDDRAEEAVAFSGMSSTQQPYFVQYGLLNGIRGLTEGIYVAELVKDSFRMAVITFGTGVPIKRRGPRKPADG